MQIFLGCTKGHEILHEVAANSFSRFTNDVNIRFLHLNALKQLGLYWRDKIKVLVLNSQSPVFILLYYLVSRAGVFFCDNDIIATSNINDILEYCDTSKAVIVVKQKQEISANEKFLGNTQAEYPKKNWSSVILWNCSHPKNKILQTELLNTIHPSFLHQFKWLADDEIGSLPGGYNYLAKTNGKRKVAQSTS